MGPAANTRSKSASSPAPSFILQLPQELLEEVISYFAPPSTTLLELRATCKEICKRTEQITGEWFFSDRMFHIRDQKSLQNLIGISVHPVFSKTITCIRLSFADDTADDFAKPDFDEELKYEAERKRLKNWRSTIIKKVTNLDEVLVCYSLGIRDAGDEDAAEKYVFQSHCKLTAPPDLRGSLRTIFSNFKATGNIPALVLNSAPGIPLDSWHMRCREPLREHNMNNRPEDLMRDGVFYKDLDILWCFETVIEAICNVEFPVPALQLGSLAFSMIIAPPALHPRIPPAPVFLSLKVLKVVFERRSSDVSEYWPMDVQPELGDKSERDLIPFLRAAKNIQILALAQGLSKCYRKQPRMIFSEICKELYDQDHQDNPGARLLPRIEELELEGIWHHTKDLETFVRATQTTLKRCRIDNGFDYDACIKGIGSSGREKLIEAYGGPGLTLEGDFFDEYERLDFDSDETTDDESGDDFTSDDESVSEGNDDERGSVIDEHNPSTDNDEE